MKAVILEDFGAVDQLVNSEVEKPVPGNNEVLVKVRAIGINPVDIKTRQGKGMATQLKAAEPMIIGWDIAGTVEESTSGALKKGDRVFGMVNFPGLGRAYAEYIAAPADHLAIIPGNCSFEEAGASTLAALTAWQALMEHAKLKAEQKVLIHAASGGVGHFAVQIAKAQGAYVIGTSSIENKRFVIGLGADEHIDYKAVKFEEEVSDVDVAFDTVGGDTAARTVGIIKKGGTIVSLLGGMKEAALDKAKAKGVSGINMMVHSSGEQMRKIADLIEKGKIRPQIEKVFQFEEMKQAHTQIESGRTIGKIVVAL